MRAYGEAGKVIGRTIILGISTSGERLQPAGRNLHTNKAEPSPRRPDTVQQGLLHRCAERTYTLLYAKAPYHVGERVFAR